MRSARRWLPLLAWLVLPAVAVAKGPPSPAQFTQLVAERVRKAAPDVTVTVVRDLELRVVGRDARESTAFLDNAYTALTQAPGDLDAIVERYVASVIETAARKEAAIRRDRIVPVIKDRGWLAEIQRTLRERGASKPPTQVWEDYNPELVIVYAEDTPRNVRYLSEQDVRALGLRKGELRALAVRNLLAILTNIELHGQAGRYMVTAGGDYEASLILADRVWTDGRLKVDGELVVAIPARDVLVVCGSRDAAGLKEVRELAKKLAGESPYRLTPALFVRRNGKFQRF